MSANALIEARKIKRDSDLLKLSRHQELFSFIDLNKRGGVAARLAREVIQDWVDNNRCGSYYINLWNIFLLNAGDGFVNALSSIDEKIAFAMCSNSPFFHACIDVNMGEIYDKPC